MLHNVVLREEDHQYFVDGTPKPGVSEILEANGFTSRFNKSDIGSQFGTNVHAMAKLLLEDDLDEESVDPGLQNPLAGIKSFLATFKPKPIEVSGERLIERPLYSEKRGYCGTLDLPAIIKNQIVVGDFKTSTCMVPAYDIQTVAYEDLLREAIVTKKTIHRWIIVLFPDKPTFKLIQLKNASDRSVWTSALNCYHWRAKHGLLIPNQKEGI